jgi:nanoRNase/pAp phosphatase (c-di-AMP/oligoRNAs hydrolase)
MMFGIQTDTDDFALASPSDFMAAAYLKRFADVTTLNRVGRRTISAEAMSAVGVALVNLEVVRDFALAGVGRISAINRDAIPIAADVILRREDIDTVLVYGIVENRIDGSLRTNAPSIDPAAFLEGVFGRDPAGRPYGGGRADKGGFQIPLGLFADVGDDERLWHVVQKAVRSRVARAVPDLAKSDGRSSVA